jgi:hypothetical protein
MVHLLMVMERSVRRSSMVCGRVALELQRNQYENSRKTMIDTYSLNSMDEPMHMPTSLPITRRASWTALWLKEEIM